MNKLYLIPIIFLVIVIVGGLNFYINSITIPEDERGPKIYEWEPPIQHDVPVCSKVGETDPSQCTINYRNP